MKKIKMFAIIFIILMLGACGVPEFENAYEAEDFISKEIADGKLEYDKFRKNYASEDADVSPEEFELYKQVIDDKLTEGIYDMKDTGLIIGYHYKFKERFEGSDASVIFVYEDGTYKVDELLIFKVRNK